MTIDAHQHFWQYDPQRHAWIDDQMKVLRRDFLPADLHPLLTSQGVDGCIAVQADQSEAETEFLLALAKANPWIKGVVGWVDLKAADLHQKLEAYQSESLLKGFRHVVQSEPDGFLADAAFRKGVALLKDFGFAYDILIFQRQLAQAVDFVAALPEMPLVIDHLAKPAMQAEAFPEWEKHMRKLAGFPHVSVKVSGLVTEADWQNWSYEQFRPYLETALELFGPARLLYGSDWPVCQLAAAYPQVKGIANTWATAMSTAEQALFFGRNAERFYQI